MSDENLVKSKTVKVAMHADDTLPTPYVNAIHAQVGPDDCFLTFGIAQPLNIQVDTDLSMIDSIEARALFRCVISRSTMKQMIDLLTAQYDMQTQQSETFQALQRKEEDDAHPNGSSSES